MRAGMHLPSSWRTSLCIGHPLHWNPPLKRPRIAVRKKSTSGTAWCFGTGSKIRHFNNSISWASGLYGAQSLCFCYSCTVLSIQKNYAQSVVHLCPSFITTQWKTCKEMPDFDIRYRCLNIKVINPRCFINNYILYSHTQPHNTINQATSLGLFQATIRPYLFKNYQ